ncbi:hypothetical protein ARMSODRAFT_899063, partial [Armillaria solidipes]
NAEQMSLFSKLMSMLTHFYPHPVHIDGHAGQEKTYVLYLIIGVLRKANQIVLLSASSAYAAKNYPGG